MAAFQLSRPVSDEKSLGSLVHIRSQMTCVIAEFSVDALLVLPEIIVRLVGQFLDSHLLTQSEEMA